MEHCHGRVLSLLLSQCYENLGRIGEGTYGVVLKCRHRSSRQLVAVKRFRQGEDNEQVGLL